MQKFKEALQRLGMQVSERQEHISNEEMAKQSLIIPFLVTLGYDVFNPLEVRPEYDSDFGIKKGEKVDYAVIKDGTPAIFIEAKAPSQKLENHDTQLARYFNATPLVKVAVITNGIVYKFFTDLNANNIMDETPFLELNITDLADADIEALAKFRKEFYDATEIVSYAEELIYTSNLNLRLEEIFKSPPDDFIRYLIKGFSDTRVTQNVLDRFRPIVKKSISNALLNLISQGLASHADQEHTPEEVIVPSTASDDSEGKKKTIVVTSDVELKSFDMVKSILSEAGKNIEDLGYKDTSVYFCIYVKNPSNWITRLNLDSQKKTITTNLPIQKVIDMAPGFIVEDAPKSFGVCRVIINSIEDMLNLKQLIVACFEDVVRN